MNEVLWISVGDRATKLQAVKVGGLKEILQLCQSRITRAPGLSPGGLDYAQSLIDPNFAL